MAYTFKEARPLISSDLKARTFRNWISDVEKWTPYRFKREVPEQPRYYKGAPQKELLFQEAEIERFEQLYFDRFVENRPLPEAIHALFLTTQDFEDWKKGEWTYDPQKNYT